jgi:ATP-dependent Zn protease
MQSMPENNVENDSNNNSVVERSKNVLYKYRWWIVLVLVIMLVYYLYARKIESSTGIPLGTSIFPTKPVLGPADLVVPEPTISLNTEGRQLFRL